MATPNRGTMQTCIVVPCYNEAGRLHGTQFAEFVESHDKISFLFVNDGSKDNTHAALEELCASHPGKLSLLDLKVNSGKAEAVRLGMLAAMRQIRPEFVGFWDADLATPLDAIPDFIEKLVGHDSLQMVFGARISVLGRQVRRKPSRHYLGRLFATVVSMVLKLPVYDTQCGAKLFRVTPRLAEILAEPFLSRWIFDVEILARTIRASNGNRHIVEDSIFELPLMKWDDVAGSKVHPFDFVRAVVEIACIHRKYLS